MNIRNQLICAWSAIGFAAICLAGFLFANFIPPISPNLSAEEVAAIYRENALSMRFGILLIMSSAGFICSFAAALAMQMKRIEGESRPRIDIHATWRWLCHYAGVCVCRRVLDGSGIPA